MNKETFFEDQVIRQFINGELEEPMLKAFKEELSVNEDLQMEVDLFAFLLADYRIKKKNHFKNLVPKGTAIEVPKEDVIELKPSLTQEGQSPVSDVNIDESVVEEPKKTYTLWPTIVKFAAAAMFIAALGLGWFVLNNQGGPSYTQLAANYLEQPYAPPIVNRGEVENTEQLWQEAVIAYKTNKFDKSAHNIENIIKQNQGKDIHHFYLGLSYLYQSPADYQMAVESLGKIEKGHYWESAKWYKSLAHLQLNEKNEAKVLLEGLKNSSHKTEVEKLLKSL